jgi:hypothetical protein
MVSEGDLLHRTETGTERCRSWWLDMMASTNKLAGDYIKSHSGKVKDVMTRDVISVTDSLRRAQIATSTPSRAKAKAIALPIPALAPVTSAVLPFIWRSMRIPVG